MRVNRQEATGIPNLLVAPKTSTNIYSRDIYEDGVGDFRGYYEDGAYYSHDAVPTSSDYPQEGNATDDPQLAYFDSILRRFEALRTQLQQTPPVEAVRTLDKDHPTHLGKLSTETARWWRWRMRTVDPLPVQIASMDKSTVLRLLGLLTGGTLLKRGMEVEMGVSRWAWGLLARLPERGELTSEEIGVVRELGKKAVLVGMGLKASEQWEAGMDEVEAGFEEDGGEAMSSVNEEEIDLNIDDGFGDNEVGGFDIDPYIPKLSQPIGPQLPAGPQGHVSGMDINVEKDPTEVEDGELDTEEAERIDEMAAAKARILARLDETGKDAVSEDIESEVSTEMEGDAPASRAEKSKWNTRATVDMIITVAGEFYGQRDLLEFRSMWSE